MSKIVNLLAVFLALAVDYFKRHPSSEECHVTSDQRVFHTEGAAIGFAHGLKDKEIKSYKRSELKAEIEGTAPEAEAEPPAPELKNQTATDAAPAGDTAPTENAFTAPAADAATATETTPAATAADAATAKLTLATFDAEKTEYVDGKALFEELGLTAKSNKKVDIFAALTAAQTAAANPKTE